MPVISRPIGSSPNFVGRRRASLFSATLVSGGGGARTFPAQEDLDYWFKVDGDIYLPDFMQDRSPNGLPDPTVLDPGQRGRMVYGDVSARTVISGAINGKSALQMGGETRLQVSNERNSPSFITYYEVGNPFTALTIFKSIALDATNSFIILPEITGNPSLVNNFAAYAFWNSGSPVLILCSDASGTTTVTAPITASTFDDYSTLLITYNGGGFSAGNFTITVNGVALTISSSALVVGSGNGGIFYGTSGTASVPTGYLLESSLWNRVLTTDEQLQLARYVYDEYALGTPVLLIDDPFTRPAPTLDEFVFPDEVKATKPEWVRFLPYAALAVAASAAIWYFLT